MQCQVCSDTVWKYKCPKCILKYCSVACYKDHVCEKKVEERQFISNKKKEQPLPFDSDDDLELLNTDQLRKLNCPEVKSLLGNKHLKQIIMEINSAKEPELALEHYQNEPIVAEIIEAINMILPSE